MARLHPAVVAWAKAAERRTRWSVALSGGADSLECLLRKIGLDDSEFTTRGGGAGRVHLFHGSGGTPRFAASLGGGDFASAGDLWGTLDAVDDYDVVFLSCEAGQFPGTKPEDAREAMANVRTYASAAQRPLMVYNNPVAYRVDLRPEHFAELADCEHVAAIKESSGDVTRITDLRNLLGDRYRLFMGVDDLAFEGLALGCDGLLAGVGCAFPRETVALYDLMKAGRFAEALKLYQWMTPMLHLDVSNKLVQNLKLIDAIVGVGTEHMRRPRLPLVGEERAFVERIVRQGMATRPTEYRSVD